MDSETYLEIIDEVIQDEGRHVNFKWLAAKLDVPANNAKKMLFEYLQVNKKKSFFVSYIVSGVAKDTQIHTVRLLSQKQMEQANTLFDLITSKHVYSIGKHAPVTSSDIYDSDAHAEYKTRLSSVKIGDPVTLRSNRYALANTRSTSAATTTPKIEPKKPEIIKREPKTEQPVAPPPVSQSQIQEQPEKKQLKEKKGTIASMFAKQATTNAKLKEETNKAKKNKDDNERMDIDEGDDDDSVQKKKAKPQTKATSEKKKKAPEKKKKQPARAKKTKKRPAELLSSDSEDDESGSNQQLILDEEDDEPVVTNTSKISYAGVKVETADDDYIPSDEDTAMSETNRRSSLRLKEKRDQTPEKKKETPKKNTKSKSSDTTPQKTTLDKFATSPVKPSGPRRTKQVKQRVFKTDEKGYQIATTEWVEVDMTEEEIKQEEEREKRQKEKAAESAKAAKGKSSTSTTKSGGKKKKAAGGNIANYFTKK